MAAAIPDRYDLEMRLGRDGDLEEWLATDTSLERPVLVRSLGPESTEHRRDEFVASVSAAAKVSHPHLTRVFAVERVDGGAYAVSEWTGGASASDRVAADQMIDLDEFLPNASGLAGALAAVHETGAVHGHIDLSAISYSVAHPAKLGGLGRPQRTDANGDVRALAGAMETALTGASPGGPPPSENLDGVDRSIDRVLRSGQSGELTAAQLEERLLAAPTPRVPQPEPRSTSRRLLIAAGVLVLAAIGLVVLGRVLSGGGPILPEQPTATTAPVVTTIDIPATTLPAEAATVFSVEAYDPFGEGGENNSLVDNVLDGDASTVWRTERYQDPITLVKPGVGLRFTVEGSPDHVQIIGFSEGTTFELRWSGVALSETTDWERVAGAKAPPGAASFKLPPRQGGYWLIWLTDVPRQNDGTYYAEIAEVRFSS